MWSVEPSEHSWVSLSRWSGPKANKRVRNSTNRVIADPPGYITQILGPRPATGANDRAWFSAVIAIEKYRVENDVTERHRAST